LEPAGELVGNGYSGDRQDWNKPEDQELRAQGPIPRGRWAIGPWEAQHARLGLLVAPLTPYPETETFGRSGFYIHGDNAAMNHTGSEGCLVLSHNLRQATANSQNRDLEVIA